MFKLDAVLEKDTHVVGDLPLCRVLLMNDSQFPWLILVPRRADLVELTDLSDDDYQAFCAESRQVSQVMMTQYNGHKMNIAALGNVVKQLHIHHIVRYPDDAVWPAPVWGKLNAVPYSHTDAQQQVKTLQERLELV